MTFQDRLNRVLNERNMKQVDLCRASGLSSAQVTHLVNGRTKDPTLHTAIKIADALNVSLDYLAGREEPKVLSFSDTETQHLADGFSQLNRDGRIAIKEQLDFQLAKNTKKEAVQAGKISGVA